MSVPSPRASSRAPGASRAALLAHLRAHGAAMSVAELAAEVGLHANTVRAHLDVLTREGKVERTTERRASRGRPRELYSATGAPEREESFAQLAAVLAAQLEHLGGRSPAIEAGKRWAQWEGLGASKPKDSRGEPIGGTTEPSSASSDVPGDAGAAGPVSAPVQEVTAVLRRTGFAPELAADGTILLRNCPFLEVAREHTDVVCGAHLGLIQGTLDRVSPGTGAELIPFAVPGACVTRLMAAP